MRLIYPSDTFSPKIVDEIYSDEYSAAKEAGLALSLFNFEEFQAGHFEPFPAIHPGEQVLYRGWMMKASEYQHLHDSITSQGGQPMTPVKSYLQCHYLPNWYPLLKEFTAETKVFLETDDLVSELSASGWNSCFLKDYVKSLSTDGGSVVRELATVPVLIDKMRKYRGQIEGGLCARRLEDYDPTTERRYFIWRGKAATSEGALPPIVLEAAARIDSPFFSVDVALRADGLLRIIELGDGQVSDLKHWRSSDFIQLISR